jgi:hypothetical protein
MEASINLGEAGNSTQIEEVAADKGDHAAATLELADAYSLRTYIPEPKRNHALKWRDKPPEYQRCVYNNRRRVRRGKSKASQRLRSERCERTFAHICETGGMRRTWLRGLENVTKRYCIAAAAHNLGRILRKLFGVGKPRALQGENRLSSLAPLLITLLSVLLACCRTLFPTPRLAHAARRPRDEASRKSEIQQAVSLTGSRCSGDGASRASPPPDPRRPSPRVRRGPGRRGVGHGATAGVVVRGRCLSHGHGLRASAFSPSGGASVVRAGAERAGGPGHEPYAGRELFRPRGV